MAGNEPKSHHYVPRGYFRPWSRGNDCVVAWRWNGGEFDHLDAVRLGAIAQRKDLHTRRGVDGAGRYEIETDLAKGFDKRLAFLRDKIVADGVSSLSVLERDEWGRIVIGLFVKRPQMIEFIRSSISEIVDLAQAQIDNHLNLTLAPDRQSISQLLQREGFGDVGNAGIEVLRSISDIPGDIRQYFAKSTWLDVRAGERVKFCTSDQPLILEPHPDGPLLILPLSPDCAFISCHGEPLRRMSSWAPEDFANAVAYFQAIECDQFVIGDIDPEIMVYSAAARMGMSDC